MYKKMKRLGCLVIALVLTSAVITGCGASETSSSGTTAAVNSAESSAAPDAGKNMVNGVDISKKVEIIIHTLGDAPKGLQAVNDEANKILEKDLNCTIKLSMIPWADAATKYDLILSSGQPSDLFFTGEWRGYQNLARKGAFLPLDDLLTKHAKEYMEFVNKDLLNACKINGKIYCTPHLWNEYQPDSFFYREDLRVKHNLPEIKDLDTMEAFMEGIKKNEPGLMPTHIHGGIGATTFINWLDGMDLDAAVGIGYKYDNPTELIDVWRSPEFMKYLKLAKKWADKGYWTKSVLSQKDDSHMAFISGKVASGIWYSDPNSVAGITDTVAKEHPDWKVGYLPYSNISRFVHAGHPIHCGTAIPKASENPERAILVLNKVFTDKTLNNIIQYGIEGTHYKITEDGKYEQIGTDYPREGADTWNFRRPEFMLYPKSYDSLLANYKEFDTYATPNIKDGFAGDLTPFNAEKAAIDQVVTQYLDPLRCGVAGDPEAALKKFLEKVDAAGRPKYFEGYKAEWKKYCDENNGFKK